jgi:hypothetical protein
LNNQLTNEKILFLFAAVLWLQGFAQTPAFPTSGDIYMGIKKLNVLGSVLYLAAHPDDENTRLLTFFSKDKLYRTGYLSLTRGDGGQNLIGEEQGVELGLDSYAGTAGSPPHRWCRAILFTAFDFGFSKSPEETFTKWDRDKILSDVVWVIRKFQPDIIVTRFPTTAKAVTASIRRRPCWVWRHLLQQSDPKRFPEQLKYVQPWQAKRILWNTFNFGG